MTNTQTANGIPAERFGSYTHYPTATIGTTDRDDLGNTIRFERMTIHAETCSQCGDFVDDGDCDDGYTGCCNEPMGDTRVLDAIIGVCFS